MRERKRSLILLMTFYKKLAKLANMIKKYRLLILFTFFISAKTQALSPEYEKQLYIGCYGNSKVYIGPDEAKTYCACTVKESGFKTPDDYLDEFNASIPRTFKSNNSRKINKKHSFYISGIAAALVLLLMFSLPREEIQEISLETIENYLINEEDQSEALSNFF